MDWGDNSDFFADVDSFVYVSESARENEQWQIVRNYEVIQGGDYVPGTPWETNHGNNAAKKLADELNASPRNGYCIVFVPRAAATGFANDKTITADFNTLPISGDQGKTIVPPLRLPSYYDKVVERGVSSLVSIRRAQHPGNPATGELYYMQTGTTSQIAEDGFAFASTHFQSRRFTSGVMVGCSNEQVSKAKRMLSQFKDSNQHPFLMVGMFAELELRRLEKLVGQHEDRYRSLKGEIQSDEWSTNPDNLQQEKRNIKFDWAAVKELFSLPCSSGSAGLDLDVERAYSEAGRNTTQNNRSQTHGFGDTVLSKAKHLYAVLKNPRGREAISKDTTSKFSWDEIKKVLSIRDRIGDAREELEAVRRQLEKGSKQIDELLGEYKSTISRIESGGDNTGSSSPSNSINGNSSNSASSNPEEEARRNLEVTQLFSDRFHDIIYRIEGFSSKCGLWVESISFWTELIRNELAREEAGISARNTKIGTVIGFAALVYLPITAAATILAMPIFGWANDWRNVKYHPVKAQTQSDNGTSTGSGSDGTPSTQLPVVSGYIWVYIGISFLFLIITLGPFIFTIRDHDRADKDRLNDDPDTNSKLRTDPSNPVGATRSPTSTRPVSNGGAVRSTYTQPNFNNRQTME